MSLLLVAFVLAACGSSTPSSDRPSDGSSGTPTMNPPASDVPTAAVTPEPGTPGASGTPSVAPSGSPTEGASPDPSAVADGCSGTEANRAFFAQAATAMDWSVYCAVLPDGWFLEAGSYRLADGGQLEVSYRGPDDAHVAVVEGNVCADVAGDVERCAPRDAVLGQASLGDRVGDLGRLSNGLVLDVDRGATPSWRVTGLGLDQDAFAALCAGFVRVGD